MSHLDDTAAQLRHYTLPTCVFCGIAGGSVECHRVYSDASATVFLDKHPINPFHLLIIPNTHVADFYELDDETYTHVMRVAKRMAGVVKAIAAPRKVGLVIAGFDVEHAHVHVIPLHNYHDITSKRILENTRPRPTGDELAEAATRLRAALAAA